MVVTLFGFNISCDGKLVNAAIGEFHFDEFFEIAKRAFRSKCRCHGCRLIGGDASFRVIGNGATATRFNAFDFDGVGAEVEQFEFGFGGFWCFHIAKIMGCFEPLYLRQIALVVVKSNVNGLIDDGFLSGLGNGFNDFEVALEYEFNNFIVGCF